MKNTEKVLYYCERKWQTRAEVLLNGNHKLIHLWQYENSLKLTKERRPDLFAAYVEKAKDLTKDEKKILEEIVSKA